MDAGRLAWITRPLSLTTACLPFGLALLASSWAHPPRPVAAAVDRPALAFKQFLVDLGPVAPTQEVLAHFDFKNRGEATVHVEGFETSCGCLQPSLRKTFYLPQERGSFQVRVQTANQEAGAREYRVKMKYHDPHPREADLVFRVQLPEYKVFVEPKALIVFNLGSNQPTIRDIAILDRRPRPLSIARVDCTRPELVNVEVGATQVDDDGQTHIHLTATIPGDLPEGRFDGMIRIFTEDPEYRVLRVPLQVQTTRRRRDANLRQVNATDED